MIAEELLLLNKEDTLKMKVAEIYIKLLGAYEEEGLLAKRMRLLSEQRKPLPNPSKRAEVRLPSWQRLMQLVTKYMLT